MKKYLVGIFAVIVAAAMSAFTMVPANSSQNEFFWYDASSGLLLDDARSALPPNGCDLSGSPICAYGHLDETNMPGVDPDEEAFYQ